RVVEVAGDLGGRVEPRLDLPPGGLEHHGREEAELDPPADLELLLEPLRVPALALMAGAEGLLGAFPVRDVAEEPDAAVVVALGAADGGAVAVEHAAVAEADLVAALLVRVLVEVGHAGEEPVGVVEAAEDGGDGGGV